MGLGSSLEVSSPVPAAGNLMVDASDSFVSDLKLRSTGIIPISEYIKKEKYKKNVQRLEQVKKLEQSDLTLSQSQSLNPKGEQDEESQESEKLPPRRRKKGSDFIETSYEDVPEKRVWIIKPSRHRSSVKKPQDTPKAKSSVVYAEPENYSDHLIIPQQTKQTKNKANTSNTIRTIEKHTIATSDNPPEAEKTPELRELYHRKHREDHRMPKRAKHQKNAKTSSTDLLKFRHRETNKDTQSTHNVKNHHFQLFNFALRNRTQKPKLTVQTNLSCTIPPNRYLIPCLKKSSSIDPNDVHPIHLKNARSPAKSATKNLRFATPPPQSVEKIEAATSSLSLTPDNRNRRAYDAPKRGLSARQALESWKNIHVQKYRERSRTMSPSAPKKAQEPLPDSYRNYSNETTPLDRDSDEIPIFRSIYHQNVRGQRKNSSTVFNRGARHNKCLQTDGSVRPSKEFLDDIERCLQRHSHLSDLYIKRNGGAKSTWVQDKYRRWHKITFEEN